MVRFLHITAHCSSSRTRFICHLCAHGFLCQPSAGSPSWGPPRRRPPAQGLPEQRQRRIAATKVWGVLAQTLRRSLRGLGRHSTCSLDAQRVLVVRRQQVMQGLTIIRMYSAVVGGVLRFVAFFKGLLKCHAEPRALRKILKLDRSIGRLHQAGSP